MEKVKIQPPFIKLEQFLKFCSACSTGGEAKLLIQQGEVQVNGEICTMRGKKLRDGDRIALNGREYLCVWD